MIVYVDVLLAVNFIVNFLLLRITALLCRKRPAPVRLIFGAAVGAFGALSLFLPPMPLFLRIFYRLALTAFVSAAVFCPCKLLGLVRAAATLLISSMLLCGALMLWQITFSPIGFIQKGGAIYFDIGAFALLFCCVLGYIAAAAFAWVMSAIPSRQFCSVSVSNNGSSCLFTVLIDTGSSLKEPFSGIPVMVCEKKAVASVIPNGFENFLTGESQGGGIRLIPYKTVGNNGVLPAFLPEKIIFRRENGEISDSCCYIAVTEDEFGGDWSGICNPAVFLSKSY